MGSDLVTAGAAVLVVVDYYLLVAWVGTTAIDNDLL